MDTALFATVIILCAAFLFLGIRLAGRLPTPWVTGVFALAAILFIGLFVLRQFVWFVGDILILLLSLSAGKTLGRIIYSWQALIAFCLALAVMDLLSFYFGPTASLMAGFRQGNTLPLQYLSISVPMGDGIQPIMGIGDTMALATAYATLTQLRYPAGWSFLAPLAGLLMATAVGLAVGGIFALPFMTVALIAYLLMDQKLARRGSP